METCEADLPFETEMNDGLDCKKSIKVSRSLLLLLIEVYQEMNNDRGCFFFVLAHGIQTLTKVVITSSVT